MGATRFNSRSFNEYKSYIEKMGEDNAKTHSALTKNLGRALHEELTEKQWRVIKMYYVDEIKMTDIAKELNLNVSTVSRTIARGLAKLKKCLRYGAKELLNEDLNSRL